MTKVLKFISIPSCEPSSLPAYIPYDCQLSVLFEKVGCSTEKYLLRKVLPASLFLKFAIFFYGQGPEHC